MSQLHIVGTAVHIRPKCCPDVEIKRTEIHAAFMSCARIRKFAAPKIGVTASNS